MSPRNKIVKTIAETPSKTIDSAIQTGKRFDKNIGNRETIKKAKKFWLALGPGLTTGAADDDPSGIATYSQTGAAYGFQLLWMAFFSLPVLATIQEMCARIGIVTGKGLAANIRLHFPKKLLYITTILLLLANISNIGVDLGAMAKAVQLLFPNLNFIFLLIFFTIFSLGLQIFLPYKKYARYLKWLAFVLISYILSTLSLHLNWGQILTQYAFIPSVHFTKESLFIICAFLGTTISPYLFFWQTSQEVEEKNGIEYKPKSEIKKMQTDVWSGMIFSNLATFFIVVACAATLFPKGITNINTAADAALALKPFAGNFAYLLFAIGIIGTGLLAVPVLAGSAAYAMSESLGWQVGLAKTLRQAKAFYGIIIFSVVIGFLINITGIPVIKALIWTAVINGIIAPTILIPIVILSSNKKLLGEHANKPITSIVGWVTTIIMGVVGIATIVSLL
jgi:NRAMP (natural resistance-associated macrophage protein)-like metal ion transporter